MITPSDIQNKKFGKGVRGYIVEEVDEFLDMLTLDMEKLIKENERLTEEIANLEESEKAHRGQEDEVSKTLRQAQKLVDDISAGAEKRAGLLIKNAEMDAEAVVRNAKDNTERLRNEYNTLQRRYEEFGERFKRMLESELERLDDMMQTEDVGQDEDMLQKILEDDDIQGSAERAEVTQETVEKPLSSGTFTGDASRKTMIVDLK